MCDQLLAAPPRPRGPCVQVRLPLLCNCGRPAAYAIFEAGELVAIDILSHHGGEKHRTILTFQQVRAIIGAAPE